MDNYTLLNKASQLAESGNFDRARQLVLRAIKNDRRDVEAWWALANVAQTNQERGRAINEVLRLEPNHMHALHMRDQMEAGTLETGGRAGKSAYVNEPKDIDYMPKVAITLIAYFVIYFIGLALNVYFLYDANEFQKRHGFKAENVGCLWAMLAVFVIAPVVMCSAVFGITMLMAGVSGY